MLGAGAGAGFGAGGFFAAAAFFGAAALGAALAFAFLADFFGALFFATTRFFLRAGAAFTRFFAFLAFDFAFFTFFAMIASRSLPQDTVRQRYYPSPRQHGGFSRRVGNPPPGKRIGRGASGRPVHQLDRVNDRDRRARSDLRHTADVTGSDHVGLELFDIADFTLAQPPRKLRLENVVRAGRTTTQMCFRYIFHHESNLGKQFFRSARDFLAVLQRARRVISNDEANRVGRRR